MRYQLSDIIFVVTLGLVFGTAVGISIVRKLRTESKRTGMLSAAAELSFSIQHARLACIESVDDLLGSFTERLGNLELELAHFDDLLKENASQLTPDTFEKLSKLYELGSAYLTRARAYLREGDISDASLSYLFASQDRDDPVSNELKITMLEVVRHSSKLLRVQHLIESSIDEIRSDKTHREN